MSLTLTWEGIKRIRTVWYLRIASIARKVQSVTSGHKTALQWNRPCHPTVFHSTGTYRAQNVTERDCHVRWPALFSGESLLFSCFWAVSIHWLDLSQFVTFSSTTFYCSTPPPPPPLETSTLPGTTPFYRQPSPNLDLVFVFWDLCFFLTLCFSA